ncbi:S8 family serine peptidase [Paenibacillus qinlingensis]|uniref:S8 family serine peptidase n=1 Tax=Paenibacillus qinlingensis TaxID=1837343 RepID=UPI0015643811|nr:S8 family serine peptidase [Paenibacillus qinlingensis]NQX62814.1 S8 family serine peptidase [Paenibacillus qinlingensis]
MVRKKTITIYLIIFITIGLLLLVAGQMRHSNSLPMNRPQVADKDLSNVVDKNAIDLLNDYYRVTDLHARGFKGAGTSVAIITFDTFQPSDIQLFSERYHLPKANINVIPLFGGAVHKGPSIKGVTESTLDINMVHAAAPDADITVYSAPDGLPLSIILKKILDEGKDQIITTSWGKMPNPAEDARCYQIIEEMSKRGMTVLAATGDYGRTLELANPLSPALLPNVVAVGGTIVTADLGFNRVIETIWPDSVRGWSTAYPLPKYQSAAAASPTLTAESKKYRMLPDIVGPSVVQTSDAISAEHGGLHFYVTNPTTGKGEWGPVIGTSVAAPYYAGLFANIAGGLHKGLGDIHSQLYKLIESPAYNKVDTTDQEHAVKGGQSFTIMSGLGSLNAYEIAIAFKLIAKEKQ